MVDLFFPQLATGAIAHYPIRKSILTRTVSNLLGDGSAVVYPDDAAKKTLWSWDYIGLRILEVNSLREFYDSCGGTLKAFTFLDPTGNLLSVSSDFRASAWKTSNLIKITDATTGPIQSVVALSAVNQAQVSQEVLPRSLARLAVLIQVSLNKAHLFRTWGSVNSKWTLLPALDVRFYRGTLLLFIAGRNWKRLTR